MMRRARALKVLIDEDSENICTRIFEIASLPKSESHLSIKERISYSLHAIADCVLVAEITPTVTIKLLRMIVKKLEWMTTHVD